MKLRDEAQREIGYYQAKLERANEQIEETIQMVKKGAAKHGVFTATMVEFIHAAYAVKATCEANIRSYELMLEFAFEDD